MVSGLTDLLFKRQKLITLFIFLWVAIAVIVGSSVPAKLSSSATNFEDPSSPSVKASKELQRATKISPDAGVIVLVDTPNGPNSQTTKDKVERITGKIAQDPAAGRVYSVYNTGDRSLVSNDGKSTFLAVYLNAGSDTAAADAAGRIETNLASEPGVKLGGSLIAGDQIAAQVEKDLIRAELLAFPILFILSFFIFRGLIASALPLICGGFAIISTFFFLQVINHFTPLSIFAINLVTGLGLGLAIDYSLFMISRFREELAKSNNTQTALKRTLGSAGKTVLFSSLTVAAAMSSLLVFPQPFLYSMAIGGLIAALMSGLTAIFVLAAILSVLGRRVNSLAPAGWQRSLEHKVSSEHTGFWYRFSHWVMRHAVVTAAGAAAFLIILGLPFLGIKFTGINAEVLPNTTSAKQVSDELNSNYQAGRTSPIYIVVKAPLSAAASVNEYATRLSHLPGVAGISPPQPQGDKLWRIDVFSAKPSLEETSKQLVKDIKKQPAPGEILIGGSTAAYLDQQASLGSHFPKVLIIIALSTLVLLFAVTRSIVLPIKSLLMSILTLSATFGILVLIFQDGRLQGLLDYTSQGALEATQPILLAVVAFALSTDYTIFLLARIREIHEAGESNTEAVARGLERTGRIITSAALLFCVAVAVFSTSKIVFIKELGLGMALAVIIDAVLVRALLVPSLMKLLGHWNWWAPKFLKFGNK